MADNIYLKSPGGFLKMSNQPYETESVLQNLLSDYPDLLAGEQMPGSEPRRWLLVTPEAAVPDSEGGSGRWALDHLFLDQDAVPTLVEVKRATDTRIRREVVAQMLEYAANGVRYWPIQSLISAFETTSRRLGKDPREELLAFLGDLQGDGDLEEHFWNQVKTNLAAGKVRMVFVADIIPPELRRIVEFMNEQMNQAEVIAVEVKQYVQGTKDEHRILVPKVIGQTERARATKSSTGGSPSARWTGEDFEAELQRNVSAQPPSRVWELYEWAKSQSNLTADYGASFSPYYEAGGQRYVPFRLAPNGRVQIVITAVRGRAPFNQPDVRLEYVRSLQRIPSVHFDDEANVREPNLDPGVPVDEGELALFKDAIERFIGLIDRYWAEQAS